MPYIYIGKSKICQRKYLLGGYTEYISETQWRENSRKYSFINPNILWSLRTSSKEADAFVTNSIHIQ